jgi:hypothetical protein
LQYTKRDNYMNYTDNQIENARRNYNRFLNYESASQQNTENPHEAERRAEYHNRIVDRIKSGDAELEREWKLFFLNQEVKADRKLAESKAKLAANKEASSDILAPIKSAKKLVEFGKWLNNAGNPFRKQHFNKKYTTEAVNTFLQTF